MAAGWLSAAQGSGPRPRAYTRLVLGLIAGVALLDLLLLGLGSIDAGALRHLGVAALLGLAGAGAWELVARSSAAPQGGRFLAWIGFPAAMLLALAAVPFLALSVYPPLEGLLFRVEARVDEGAGEIEIAFPLPVEPGPINLRLGTTEVPDAYARKNPGLFRWPTPRLLRMDVKRLLEDLSTRRPATIEINAIRGSPLFRYASGQPVPEQKVPLK